MHGQYNHACLPRQAVYALAHVQPVQAGQHEIEDQNERLELLHQPQRLQTVGRFADQLNVGFLFEQRPQPLAHQDVVIGQQYGDLHKHPHFR